MDASDVRAITASAGVVIARGGITADGAIAARALGKPCIVGCSSVSLTKDALKGESLVLPGASVTIDGSAGTIEV
jgi:pyruvate,orthophosphate dikinase